MNNADRALGLGKNVNVFLQKLISIEKQVAIFWLHWQVSSHKKKKKRLTETEDEKQKVDHIENIYICKLT